MLIIAPNDRPRLLLYRQPCLSKIWPPAQVPLFFSGEYGLIFRDSNMLTGLENAWGYSWYYDR